MGHHNPEPKPSQAGKNKGHPCYHKGDGLDLSLILRILEKSGGMTASEVAAKLSCSTRQVSGAIKELHRIDKVIKVPLPTASPTGKRLILWRARSKYAQLLMSKPWTKKALAEPIKRI